MLRKFLLNDKDIEKQSVLWNMIATMASSFQTMILMLVMTRNDDMTSASIITIGYAVANLAMTIGKYGIRNFQVSDVKEKYSFRTYLHARYITVTALIVFSIAYVIQGIFFDGYSIEKACCVILICMYRGIESAEDVFHGRMQQKNRLDIGMRILAIRNVLYIVEFIVVYCITHNLLVTLLSAVLTTLILALLLNWIPEKEIYYNLKQDNGVQSGSVKALLLECLPVALASFLLTYLGNAPKYVIDGVVSDAEQTYFNILFMVTFAVNMLSMFIFNPLLRRMAVLWNEEKTDEFKSQIKKLFLYIFGIVVLAVVFATVIGRRLLGWVYGVSLENYKVELNLMLLAGGMLAMLNLMNLLFVIVRKQKILMVLCALGSLMMVVLGEQVLLQFNILGLIILYIAVLAVVNVVLLLTFNNLIRKARS